MQRKELLKILPSNRNIPDYSMCVTFPLGSHMETTLYVSNVCL